MDRSLYCDNCLQLKHTYPHMATPLYAAVTKVSVRAMTPMAAHIMRRLAVAQKEK